MEWERFCTSADRRLVIFSGPQAAFRSSFRVRLTAALAAFFVLPMLAFAAWSYARLREDARQDGDLLIRQTLRDAAATAGQMDFERPATLDSASPPKRWDGGPPREGLPAVATLRAR